MAVAEGWRGRGVGTRLLEPLFDWAGTQESTRSSSKCGRTTSAAASRLYEKFGFEVEGRRRRHWRRRNGELWDTIMMGLVLDEESPGSPFPDA